MLRRKQSRGKDHRNGQEQRIGISEFRIHRRSKPKAHNEYDHRDGQQEFLSLPPYVQRTAAKKDPDIQANAVQRLKNDRLFQIPEQRTEQAADSIPSSGTDDAKVIGVHTLGVDPEKIILKKLDKTRKKYPVDKAKGVSTKYNKL